MKIAKTTDYSTLSNNIRLLIDSRGMTVADFCSEVGITGATMSRYLSGKREPSLSYLIQIAKYFNVSIDWILGISGDKFDVLPSDIQDVVSLYSLATEDDRRVIRTVLSKYKDKE